MNVDIRNRGLTAYIQGQNAVGTSVFLNRLHTGQAPDVLEPTQREG